MPHISAGVEYALHCLVFLVDRPPEAMAPSSRDLAELQGVPVDYAAKLFTRLQKAGIVLTSEGVAGGQRLACDPTTVSVEDVVVAIDGAHPLFECREIRARCAVADSECPGWATESLCGIHQLMRQAEAAMREVLRGVSLADLAGSFAARSSSRFHADVADWLLERATHRSASRREPREKS